MNEKAGKAGGAEKIAINKRDPHSYRPPRLDRTFAAAASAVIAGSDAALEAVGFGARAEPEAEADDDDVIVAAESGDDKNCYQTPEPKKVKQHCTLLQPSE